MGNKQVFVPSMVWTILVGQVSDSQSQSEGHESHDNGTEQAVKAEQGE